ncbi:MAG TPA: SDR family NAD(P)-dependent oxidoreductase [Geminicoccaceae bacterium]|nr:SDR family NAD(P)-dependent oxidoreductase [Geminicoccaceae bacterium]
MTSAAKGDLPQVALPNLPSYPVLRSQKALVTGAGSGIGRAVALALGRAGAAVAVNYRVKEDEARAIVDEIEAGGGAAFAVQGDVSREADVQRMFAQAVERFGRLDILVNNAGLQRDVPFEAMTLEQWQKVIDVNLTGQFLCAREAVREFRRHGVVEGVSVAAGKIVCISSVHDVIPWAGRVNYAASKGGVMLMMKSIAQEVAPHRIRINSVSRARSARRSTARPGRPRPSTASSWS